jgi:ABC-type bacteriocin/lantibiotic exporter with double-glycine peptidase domain
LVGRSGSGKSTIAKLVLGLHQPWSGQILFDGVPRADHASADVQATVAGVDQDIILFEGSVRDNLSLWDSTLPEKDMLQAARDACIHSSILSLPAGYAAQVDERGRNFSGGQAQRLEIARAFASNPRILVLDEASAALDPITEKIIDEQIRRRGCACLIVAHRLSTIRDCDEIIVLERGTILERGSHAELISRQGAYSRLIDMA